MPPDIPKGERRLPSGELIARTKGFLDPDEGFLLHDCGLIASRQGPCLEIGSYCGKSALYLASACKAHGAVLFSVDHHRGSEEQQPGEAYHDPDLVDAASGRIDTFRFFRQTLREAGLSDTVVPMVCASAVAARAWSTPLALIFIDGGHSYETVLEDYRLWSPHLIPGGYLLFHDIFEDPAQGGQAPWRVMQQAISSGRFRQVARRDSLVVLQR